MYNSSYGMKISSCPTLEAVLFNSWYTQVRPEVISWPPDPVQKKLWVKYDKNNAKYYIYMYNSSQGVKNSSCPNLEPV